MSRALNRPDPSSGEAHSDTYREETFLRLAQRVSECRACPRMEGRARVLGAANGNLRAEALFIAEAPGRLGADLSHIPLSGDQTGRNFQALLDQAGLRREDVFITNAALCNPRDVSGNNAPPTRREIGNCACHLRETIEIVQPRFVVTLGTIALRSLDLIEPHALILSRDVGKCSQWFGRSLIPLYHPGSRARIHRPVEMQQADFRNLALLVMANAAERRPGR